MKYFIIVASQNHVAIGVDQGFAQAGHGQKANLKKINKGDWVIYYSSKDRLENGKPYQKFTAIGQVSDEHPYQVSVSDAFEPWRRQVHYYAAREVDIHPLLGDLSLVTNRQHWGLHFRSGFVEIDKNDFELIARSMLIHKKL